MIKHITRDERFLVMAKELGFDIYDDNPAGGHYAPLLRHDDEQAVPQWPGAAHERQNPVPRPSGAGAQSGRCSGGREHQRYRALWR